ncbi:MAG TPA: DUF2442 domain-containing protein [Tepidisphaeraceae bacterium]|nr:DUF2442 domain-containing protein [Tepidisphaeraceae bacterium]
MTKTEKTPEPVGAKVTADTLTVDLADGRTIAVPLVWFPRLMHGTPRQRANFELGVFGIHWPELDEDIPVAGLLNGEKSGESSRSLQRWLDSRKQMERNSQAKRGKKSA